VQFLIGQVSTGVALYAERLTVALGFVTFFFALASFASCRSCLSLLGYLGVKSPVDKKWFQSFYNLHGYYWYGFLLLLLFHLMSSVMHTALPSLSDPDGAIHLIILSFGLVSFLFVGAVLLSCRSLVNLLNLFTEKGPMSSRGFRSYYRYHNLFWGILFLTVAGHIVSGYVHVGFWPNAI
jgi:hypothetical protein